MKSGDKVKVKSDRGELLEAEIIEVLGENHMYAGHIHCKVKVPRALTWQEQTFNLKPYIIQDWICKYSDIYE